MHLPCYSCASILCQGLSGTSGGLWPDCSFWIMWIFRHCRCFCLACRVLPVLCLAPPAIQQFFFFAATRDVFRSSITPSFILTMWASSWASLFSSSISASLSSISELSSPFWSLRAWLTLPKLSLLLRSRLYFLAAPRIPQWLVPLHLPQEVVQVDGMLGSFSLFGFGLVTFTVMLVQATAVAEINTLQPCVVTPTNGTFQCSLRHFCGIDRSCIQMVIEFS